MNFAELRVQKSAPWLRCFWRYPRCLVGYCLSQHRLWQYRGCTLGFSKSFRKQKADIRVQKFACGLRNQPYYILPWFFPQWIRGPSFWDLGKKKKPIFWLGGPPNPSPPQIRRITIFYFIFYLSTQPKKTYPNYDGIDDRLFWLVLPRVEG